MAIQATGLGSGLDIEGLVTQLVAAERSPIEGRIFKRERNITSDISALGALKSALSDLDSSTAAVRSTQTYSDRIATSSDSSKVSVTATSSAALGSYDLEVSGLGRCAVPCRPSSVFLANRGGGYRHTYFYLWHHRLHGS
jgi:flagellar hook-associated protein 2